MDLPALVTAALPSGQSEFRSFDRFYVNERLNYASDISELRPLMSGSIRRPCQLP